MNNNVEVIWWIVMHGVLIGHDSWWLLTFKHSFLSCIMNFTKLISSPNIKIPVAYKGTECVRKPPAATTQRVWRRRTSNLALSGVSKFAPLAFLTGANSSSRTTYLDKTFQVPLLDKYAFSCYRRLGSIWKYRMAITSYSVVEGV